MPRKVRPYCASESAFLHCSFSRDFLYCSLEQPLPTRREGGRLTRTGAAAATATVVAAAAAAATAAAASAELAKLAAQSRHELGAPIGRGCALRLNVDDMGSHHGCVPDAHVHVCSAHAHAQCTCTCAGLRLQRLPEGLWHARPAAWQRAAPLHRLYATT